MEIEIIYGFFENGSDINQKYAINKVLQHFNC